LWVEERLSNFLVSALHEIVEVTTGSAMEEMQENLLRTGDQRQRTRREWEKLSGIYFLLV
jgi:hypothetical protein